jgi:hypothetical protein
MSESEDLVFSYVISLQGKTEGEGKAKLDEALANGYRVIDILAVPVLGSPNHISCTSVTVLVSKDQAKLLPYKKFLAK